MMDNKKSPKIAVCAANKVGYEAVEFILNQTYPIEFFATSEKDDSEYEEKISAMVESYGGDFFSKVNVNDSSFVDELKKREIDIVILAWWPAIVKKESIDSVNEGWINMHPSLIPFNRGKHPYYWAIVEGTRFGVTLHYIDKGIDTGPILFQKEIPIRPEDTGESLYEKSLEEMMNLFKESYDKITRMDFIPKKQDDETATFHWGKMLEPHSTINLDDTFTARDLINRIRARTFTNGDSSKFVIDDKTYRMKLSIEEVSNKKGIDPWLMAGPSITDSDRDIVLDALKTESMYEKRYYYVEKFEKAFAEYHDRKYALMTTNCTQALHLLYLSLGIKEGDEVIVPDCTWTGSLAALTENYLRAKIVFADIDEKNWCIDPKSVLDNITDKTKAVIAVDLYGNMPDYDKLKKICNEKGIYLIEDSAEALGSTYKNVRAGKFGVGSVFSFHVTKTISTGEGGMLLLDDEKVYLRAKFLRDCGRSTDNPYDVLEPTLKYMPDNFRAALGYAQFTRIKEIIDKKRWIFHTFKEKLKDIPNLEFNEESDDVYNGVWATSLIVGREYGITKEELMRKLSEKGLPVRPFFYPSSSLKAYAGYKTGSAEKNPVSYDVSSRGITLPSALILTEKDIEIYCQGIREILLDR